MATTYTERAIGWNEGEGMQCKESQSWWAKGGKDGEEGSHSKNKETFQIIPDYKNAKSGPEREDGGSKVYACF